MNGFWAVAGGFLFGGTGFAAIYPVVFVIAGHHFAKK